MGRWPRRTRTKMMYGTMRSPLEQFEIVGRGARGLDRPGRTNTGRVMRATAARIVLAHEVALPPVVTTTGATGQTVVKGGGRRVATRRQTAREGIYARVGSMVMQTMGEKGEGLYTFIYTLRIYILGRNRLGLIPYGFTATSHLAVTLTLALTVWVGKRILGVRRHGIKRLGMMLPAGTPMARVPRRVPLERMSFFITFISLSVRLFANMMAGHILLKVIGGFSWSLRRGSAGAGATMARAMYLLHLRPRVVLFRLMRLETGVGFIQAYVFALLSCIYLADMIEGGH